MFSCQAHEDKSESPTANSSLREQQWELLTSSCDYNQLVINRTFDPKYQELLRLIHSLAQSTEVPLPYLAAPVLILEENLDLNQYRDAS